MGSPQAKPSHWKSPPSLRSRSALGGLLCSITVWEHHWKGSLSAKVVMDSRAGAVGQLCSLWGDFSWSLSSSKVKHLSIARGQLDSLFISICTSHLMKFGQLTFMNQLLSIKHFYTFNPVHIYTRYKYAHTNDKKLKLRDSVLLG